MMGREVMWFADSPDVGLPECVCSWCGGVIGRDQVPVRITDLERDLEARFHLDCYKEVTIGGEDERQDEQCPNCGIVRWQATMRISQQRSVCICGYIWPNVLATDKVIRGR